jgi:hypothetical protein
MVLGLEVDFQSMIGKEKKQKKNMKRILDLVSDLQLDRRMLKDKAR